MPGHRQDVDSHHSEVVARLRDSMYEHDLCPECVGELDEYGDCLDCGHDAYLEVQERTVDL